MRLRKWRPIYGWAEFAYEILKIVLGVLIALGIGSVVDALRWRSEVASTRDALNDEIAVSAGYALDRLAIEPCLRQRIGHLADAVRKPSRWKGDPLPVSKGTIQRGVLPRVYTVPVRAWPISTWESVVQSGVLGHMDREEARSYSTIYRHIEVLRETQAREIALAPQLVPLAFDQTLTQRRGDDYLTILAELDSLENRVSAFAREIMPLVQDVGVLRSPDRVAAINKYPPIQRKLRGRCVNLLRINLQPGSHDRSYVR